MARLCEKKSLEYPDLDPRFGAICGFLKSSNVNKLQIGGDPSLPFSDTGCIALFPQTVLKQDCRYELAAYIFPDHEITYFQMYQQILEISREPENIPQNSVKLFEELRSQALKREPSIVLVTGYNSNPNNPASILAYCPGHTTGSAIRLLKDKVLEIKASHQ
jgi:hypothetical protein